MRKRKGSFGGTIIIVILIALFAYGKSGNYTPNQTNNATKTAQSNLNGSSSTKSASATGSSIENQVKNKWHELKNSITDSSSSSPSSTQSVGSTDDKKTYSDLANMNYKSGSPVVVNVNNGQSILDKNSWTSSHIDYSPLDSLNRTQVAIAYLDKDNLGKSAGRDAQTWDPTGWHNQAKYVNGKRVFPQNRGHLIAYTVTFNLNQNGKYEQGKRGSEDNPKNLATQTAYSNQVPMQTFEEKVRDSLASGHKVIYRVTPVFRGNELMPRGYWTQAISTDGSLNFNAYIFNVQPGISFDYATGTSKVDSSVTIPE